MEYIENEKFTLLRMLVIMSLADNRISTEEIDYMRESCKKLCFRGKIISKRSRNYFLLKKSDKVCRR